MTHPGPGSTTVTDSHVRHRTGGYGVRPRQQHLHPPDDHRAATAARSRSPSPREAPTDRPRTFSSSRTTALSRACPWRGPNPPRQYPNVQPGANPTVAAPPPAGRPACRPREGRDPTCGGQALRGPRPACSPPSGSTSARRAGHRASPRPERCSAATRHPARPSHPAPASTLVHLLGPTDVPGPRRDRERRRRRHLRDQESACAVAMTVTTESADAAPNTVLRTSPPSGAKVAAGSTRSAVRRQGGRGVVFGVPVPSVIGQSRLDHRRLWNPPG